MCKITKEKYSYFRFRKYISLYWRVVAKKKAKEAAKAERDEKARIRKANDVILTSSTCTYATAAAIAADAKKAEAAAKRKLKKQQEDAENERILRERAEEKAKDDERYYTIIQHSNSIISKFNVNNTSYFSNNPTSKRFIGIQV